jgi:hypothetical protein
MAENNNIEELSKNISNDFWIEQEKAEELVKSESIKSREDLQKELVNLEINDFDNNKIDKLLYSLLDAKNIIEKDNLISQERVKRESFAWEIELQNLVKNNLQNNEKEKIYYVSNKLFSTDFINKWQNPNSFGDQLKWGLLWSINTLESVSKLAFVDLPLGILKTPNDLIALSKWANYNRTA